MSAYQIIRQVAICGWLLLTVPLGVLGLTDDEEIAARKLVNSQGCKACHKLEGAGGTLASALDDLSERLTKEEIRSTLVNPGGVHGDGRIADFSHLAEREIEALVKFLNRPSSP